MVFRADERDEGFKPPLSQWPIADFPHQNPLKPALQCSPLIWTLPLFELDTNSWASHASSYYADFALGIWTRLYCHILEPSRHLIASLGSKLDNSTMVCHYCVNLDLDQIRSENVYLHHVSIEELRCSANGGCEGCAAIVCCRDPVGHRSWDQQYLTENISELPYTQIICTALEEGIDSKIWGLNFWQPDLVEKTEVFMCKVYCFVESGKWRNN
jgi:hypothetical protein